MGKTTVTEIPPGPCCIFVLYHNNDDSVEGKWEGKERERKSPYTYNNNIIVHTELVNRVPCDQNQV